MDNVRNILTKKSFINNSLNNLNIKEVKFKRFRCLKIVFLNNGRVEIEIILYWYIKNF